MAEMDRFCPPWMMQPAASRMVPAKQTAFSRSLTMQQISRSLTICKVGWNSPDSLPASIAGCPSEQLPPWRCRDQSASLCTPEGRGGEGGVGGPHFHGCRTCGQPIPVTQTTWAPFRTSMPPAPSLRWSFPLLPKPAAWSSDLPSSSEADEPEMLAAACSFCCGSVVAVLKCPAEAA